MSTTIPYKIRPHRVESAGKDIVIWGETAKLDDFLNGIASAPLAESTNRVVSVKAATVKRYPGDPGYSRAAHQRIYSPDRGIQGGTTPGRAFWIEEEVLVAGLLEVGKDVFQFTLVGPFYALKSYCVANAKKDFVLRSPGGRAHPIAAD